MRDNFAPTKSPVPTINTSCLYQNIFLCFLRYTTADAQEQTRLQHFFKSTPPPQKKKSLQTLSQQWQRHDDELATRQPAKVYIYIVAFVAPSTTVDHSVND